MTIIEVLFAIVILSGVMLSLTRFGQGFARASRRAAHLTVASDLAAARLEVIRSHGVYGTLVSSFHNTTETSAVSGANPSMDGYEGYTRTTQAVRTQTDSTDFVTVTVSVTAPPGVLDAALRKTLVIGAP
jgi:type II secretory pathway pseudopilin PulG